MWLHNLCHLHLEIGRWSEMYGKGSQGRPRTPLDSVSKEIRSQMQEKKLEKPQKNEDLTGI